MLRLLFLLGGLLTACEPFLALAQAAAATLPGHRTVAILPMEVAQPKLSDVRFTFLNVLTAKRQQQEASQRQEGRKVAGQRPQQQPAGQQNRGHAPILQALGS